MRQFGHRRIECYIIDSLMISSIIRIQFNLKAVMIEPRQVKMPRAKEAEHNISVRTVKSMSQYNVGDYLPTQESSQSRSIINIHRFREKNITEPVQKAAENDELYKKVVLLEQEKLVLKVELQRSKRDLMTCQQNLKGKQLEISQTKKKEEETMNKLKELEKKSQSRILLQRNTVQFQIFPKFKQSYQVSVQTEPIVEQHLINKEVKNISAPTSSDMQHIYQKMESLKMGRRVSKPEFVNVPTNFTNNLKAERPRAFTSNWSTFTKDKQNIMRESNVIQRKTTEKQNKVRVQNLDIFSMPLQQGQRLLTAYIQDTYF